MAIAASARTQHSAAGAAAVAAGPLPAAVAATAQRVADATQAARSAIQQGPAPMEILGDAPDAGVLAVPPPLSIRIEVLMEQAYRDAAATIRANESKVVYTLSSRHDVHHQTRHSGQRMLYKIEQNCTSRTFPTFARYCGVDTQARLRNETNLWMTVSFRCIVRGTCTTFTRDYDLA